MSAKGKYKLTYFDGRGRAEPIRLALAAAGVEFEDNRVGEKDWPSVKPKTLMGYMPELEVDGVPMCETKVLIGYVGREYGLHGKTNLEAAKVDMFVGMLCDLDTSMYESIMGPDDKKAELIEKFLTEKMPAFLDKFEKLAGSPWLVGSDMTVADLVLFNTNTALGLVKTSLDKYEKLAAIVQKVKENPKVAAWLERRPKTEW